MSGYDGIRERIHAALDRDGQHDWDETARLADVIAPVVWNDPDLLDSALAEAELVCPDGWYFHLSSRGHDGYRAVAFRHVDLGGGYGQDRAVATGIGSTPAGAVRMLAAKLRDA